MAATIVGGRSTARRALDGLVKRAVKVAAPLTTPLFADDYLTLVDPLLSTRGLRARVERVVRETDDAATLVLRPGIGWDGHTAGQYLKVGVEIDGVWHSRTYSLTSPEGASDGLISITVKAIPDGVVSNHLVRRTTAGTILRLDGVQGQFVLPDPLPRRILFVTGGSGITPVLGMLRTLDRRGLLSPEGPDVVHVHSSLRADDAICGEELRGLADRVPSYRLVERHTDSQGLMSASGLGDVVPDWRDRQTWACGPGGMLDDLETHFAEQGHELLHVERFNPPVFAAPDSDGGTVEFATSGRTVDAAPGQPLLTVGEEAGIDMPSGCRMGICMSCVTPLRSGQVRDLRTGEVHGEEGDLVQTCVSAAAGDCALDR